MTASVPFKDLSFGDYSGLREYKRNPNFFLSSFVSPETFSLGSLRNDANFIIVGRKGTGKSSCCLALADEKVRDGFSAKFYNFSDDLSRIDLKEAVQTQALDLKDISTKKLFDSITEFYDFRDLWKRKVLHAIARDQKKSSTFTEFLLSVQLSESSISEGVGKGLTVEVPGVLASLPFLSKAAKISDTKISLRDYVKIGLDLLQECHPNVKQYFFFDELNLSHAKSQTDEYNTLISLVRDIVRATADLNDFFVEKSLDVHVVCSLRPEVRNEVINRDNELSKVIDSNFANLAWSARESEENPLLDLLKKKLANSHSPNLDPSEVLPDRVFNVPEQKELEFYKFFLNLTWYRPRDVIRFLKCYQSTNGEQKKMFSRSDDQLRFLKEYSRVSYYDCIAELEVKYSRKALDEAMSRIKRPIYQNLEHFLSELDVLSNRLDVEEFAKDLFDAGVLFNHQPAENRVHVVASYRDDARINRDLRLIVHRGLQASMHLIET